jgi:hypothetical protein
MSTLKEILLMSFSLESHNSSTTVVWVGVVSGTPDDPALPEGRPTRVSHQEDGDGAL